VTTDDLISDNKTGQAVDRAGDASTRNGRVGAASAVGGRDAAGRGGDAGPMIADPDAQLMKE
jgi:hypothetical protein